MMPAQYQPFLLGIDLGSSSLGWAVVRADPEGKPVQLTAAGVRIFDPGVAAGNLEMIQQGKDESKAAKRREMRLQRRQMRRRAARQRELFELLQDHGLLPRYAHAIDAGKPHEQNAQRSAARHDILNRLDAELYARWKERLRSRGSGLPAGDHVFPYYLRARALDQKLELVELGRAIYHLGQRRGFLSNRKQAARTEKDKEELGAVKKGISELQQAMNAAGARTLGEYFSCLDPTAARIRARWTARAMFLHEFEAIWQAQCAHYPEVLNEGLREKVRKLLFFQRPIARQEHLIGECELERGQKRAPMYMLEAQRFRLLQRVNDLRVRNADFAERRLTNDERNKLLQALETQGDHTFAKVRDLLGLPKREVAFNLERGGEKNLRGNRTASLMQRAFGEQWTGFLPDRQKEIVDKWANEENNETLQSFARQEWGLDEEGARKLAKTDPEPNYISLSLRAIGKLLPMMEDGFSFKEAEKEIYGARFAGEKPYGQLPPVREALPSMRNPAVERALTELRKVVNAIVRRYGKAAEIHVELARDLKQARQHRERTWKAMRERQDLRNSAEDSILKEFGRMKGDFRVSRADKEKFLLWKECGERCPYTGRTISFTDLFGEHPQFDVEHILPFSRCPDNSFANKTLCEINENRNRKHKHTPREAYGPDAERWEEIIERVEKFQRIAPGAATREASGGTRKGGWNIQVPGKLKRFLVKTQEELEQFSQRLLQDTRYTSKLAARYLGLLYGGRDQRMPDGTARQRIFSSSGALTAELRRNWGLEEILRDADPAATAEAKAKPRGDHRHHAIDALVVALTSPAAVKALSGAAERIAGQGRVAFKGLEAPWPDFVASVRLHIENLVVSHRPEHKLSGQLHDETLYGKPYEENGKTYVHVRKAVDALTKNEIEDIVDPAVRAAVQEHLADLGGDLKKLQAVGVVPPGLMARGGQRIPIRRVRIRKALSIESVGQAPRERFIAPNNNHHMEIVAQLDERENEVRWKAVAVTRLDAQQRRQRCLPIVQREHGLGTRYKFSLMGGDTVEVSMDAKPELRVVRTLAKNGQISLVHINDARKIADIKAAGGWWSPRAETLRKLYARKVVVDLLGKIHPAND